MHKWFEKLNFGIRYYIALDCKNGFDDCLAIVCHNVQEKLRKSNENIKIWIVWRYNFIKHILQKTA